MRLATSMAFVCFFAAGSAIQAAPILVVGSSTYAGLSDGALVSWTHTFTTGSPDVTIQQIKITLRGGLFFDTNAASPGFGLSQDVNTTSPGGTGFTGFSAAGVTLDGGNTVTLTFSDFNAGETYTHTGDVDQALALQNCSGLSVGAAIACGLANVATSLNASIVTGSEFAGSTIAVTLGGPGYSPLLVTGTFVQTGALTATADWSGTVVPEPSTWVLCGLGLIGIAGNSLRRARLLRRSDH